MSASDSSGLIPECCDAVRLFREGAISEQDMWAVLNFHMRERLKAQGLLDDHEKQKYPRKTDLFVNHADSSRAGMVLWRSSEEVGVKYFDNNEQDSLPIESFDSYDSKGGRTKWELY